MTSSRPLLSGSVPTRGQIVQRWLLRTLAGRLLLTGIAIKLVTAVVTRVAPATSGVLDLIDVIGSLLLIFVAGYGLSRLVVQAKRRLLWRVRRKLILSYVFVGLVPSLLIIVFFLLAGLLLFFNISSFLLQSRVRTVTEQAGYMAQAVVLEAEHGDPADTLRRRLQQRQRSWNERYPFTSLAIVPVTGKTCTKAAVAVGPAPRAMTVGPWEHLDAPERVPAWVPCEGVNSLMTYRVEGESGTHRRFVARAVALPQGPAPQWAVIMDVPFTQLIEERLRDETGITLGPISPDPVVGEPVGRLLESATTELGDGTVLGGAWVAVLGVQDWTTGTSGSETASIRLNLPQIYSRLSDWSGGDAITRYLLIVLGFIGMLFWTIQMVALVIGFTLARQITGAVHDLFTGTEHLRNRNFSHHIPVRARDQLGELADSFNAMTSEVTKLLKENADKARMEQEMLAAREIQQKLLPSGPFHVPGIAVMAFCEPAREVAGDYYDFLPISDTKLGVLIADVSGKGLPAGLYMAQLKVLVQSLARTHPSPRDFLIATNRVVADNIDSKSFITMSYAVIDLERREMVYARAGHCPLIRVPGNLPAGLRKSELLAPDGLVLGLKIDDGQMFDAMIREETIPLAPEDLVVFFTDGISETMNEAFDCYGEPRLAKVLEQYAHLPFEQLRAFIFADLRAFAGTADQHDDMTMILLKVDALTRALPAVSS